MKITMDFIGIYFQQVFFTLFHVIFHDKQFWNDLPQSVSLSDFKQVFPSIPHNKIQNWVQNQIEMQSISKALNLWIEPLLKSPVY